MEGVNVSLLDANQPEPSKAPRYIILGVIAVFLIAFLIWHQVRYDAEKKVASEFFSALTSGDVQQAYKIWQPAADYSFKDFQQDWGPDRKSTRLNSSHPSISYAVFCLKKKKKKQHE